jgi:hypothetical protein
MMKLIRLGWTLTMFKNATDGTLYVELTAPKSAFTVQLKACENVDLAPGFEALTSVETCVRKYMISKGL